MSLSDTKTQQLQEQLKEWDAHIKTGAGNKIRHLCRKLTGKEIPRHLIIDYCHIARRIGAPELIIRWLRPYVRAEKIQMKDQARDEEKALYALGLFRLGAFREATHLLKECHPQQDPQIHFYRASLAMNQWSYDKAILELRRYLRDSRVPLYSRLVGRLNLCASLVSNGDLKKAEEEIQITFKMIEKKKIPLLKGNLLEIQSQLFYEQEQWEKALIHLEEANSLLQRADERSLLYVEKWKATIHAKINPDSFNSQNPFSEIKEKAIKIQDWETLRACDLILAHTKKDPHLFLKVYWGSRFEDYKKRIKKIFNADIEIKNQFIYSFTPSSREFFSEKKPHHNSIESKSQEEPVASNRPPIDLVELAKGVYLKKLFFILTREFYRPLRVTEIIDFIYTDEFYNPITSLQKFHQLMKRARLWLQEQQLPFAIEAHRNAFKLTALEPCSLLLKSEFTKSHANESFECPLEFRNKPFSAVEWSNYYKISHRTASRQLQRLVKSLHLQKKGFGRATQYMAYP